MIRNGLIFLLLLLLLSSCNAIKGVQFPENYSEQLPESAKITIPHIKQYDSYSCATTSLAMVMSYHDQKTYRKSEVWKASKSNIDMVKNVCGNDMHGLKKAAKHYGFTDYEFAIGVNIDALKYLISRNIPVIVNIRNFYKQSYHAVVVTGYDETGVFISDPASNQSSYKKNFSTFMAHWYANLCSPRGQYRKSAFIVYPKH